MDSKTSTYLKRRSALTRHLHISILKSFLLLSTLAVLLLFPLLISAAPPPPSDEPLAGIFTPTTAHSLISIAWLLFLLSAGLAALAALCLAYDQLAIRAFGDVGLVRTGWGPEQWGVLAIGGVGFLLLGGFLVCGLAVAAYNTGVGIVAAAFMGLLMGAIVGLAIYQRK